MKTAEVSRDYPDARRVFAQMPHPFHSLIADGVYVRNEMGSLVFRALPSPSKAEVQAVAWSTCERVCKLLRKRGL